MLVRYIVFRIRLFELINLYFVKYHLQQTTFRAILFDLGIIYLYLLYNLICIQSYRIKVLQKFPYFCQVKTVLSGKVYHPLGFMNNFHRLLSRQIKKMKNSFMLIRIIVCIYVSIKITSYCLFFFFFFVVFGGF